MKKNRNDKKSGNKLLKFLPFGFVTASLAVAIGLASTIVKPKEVIAEDDAKVAGETSYNVNNLEDITNIVNGSLSDDYVITSDEYDNDKIDANEEIWAIVKLKGSSLLDNYLASNKEVSLNNYIKTEANVAYENELLKNHNKVFESIKGYALSNIKYNYTTILNGFSIPIRYKDVERIEESKLVESVIISERYYPQEVTSVTSPSITENEVNVYSTGIYNSSNVAYDGTNTIVAVLDTGLDYTHSAFKQMPVGDVCYTYDGISQLVGQTTAAKLSKSKESGAFDLTTNDVYISKKVPFAYDYADKDNNVYPVNDHGTHVAGIIAGKDDTITGVATNAQLAIMKVFSDKDAGAETADILSALSDCILLNVDVINMSLGTSCGFSRDTDKDETNAIYDGIKEAGISLITAASNDYSAAMGSDNGDTNLTSNPDSGTVGSPSSYAAAMSIASISGVKTAYFTLNGQAIYYRESSTTTGDQKHFMDEFLGNEDSKTVEYVTIPGLGSSSDYIGLDVKGKVAVIQRGVTTFEEKILTAQAMGAAAVVVYNNQSGNISMSVGNTTKIPSCSISMDMGALFKKQTSGTLYFSKENLAGPFMSDFSSWGVLPNLELKPDITAHGGDILSAVRGGYDRLSGTSMACPNMAGATTLVRQYVKEKFPDLNNVEVTNLTYQLMMSTATIALNEQGNPYSPRKQGAGLADILKATTTNSYLWVDGDNKTKLSLGDDPTKSGKYVLTFNITNMSNITESYNIKPIVYTESVSSDGKTVAEKAYMINDFLYDVKVEGAILSNNHIIVKGYDSATITVTIELNDETKKYLDDNFINGMFVEGFVCLENDDNYVDLNIPYVAFYGDWTVAPIFDITEYEYAESQKDTAVLEKDKLKADAYPSVPLGGFKINVNSDDEDNDASWGLGVYGYNLADGYEKPYSDADKAAITQKESGLYKLAAVSAGLIRGAKTIDVEIYNSVTHELVYSDTIQNGRKSHYSGSRVGGYIEIDLSAAEYGLKNNTKYTIDMYAYLDWEGEQHNKKNFLTFDFYVDSESPVMQEDLTKVRIKEDSEGNKTYYLDMYVYDNHYLECYTIASYTSIAADGSLNDRKAIINSTIPIDSARGVTNVVTLDITDYWKDLVDNDLNIAVEFIDYARNTSTYKFKLPDTVAKEISFNQDSYNIKPNQAYDLFKIITLNPSDSFKHLVDFESSDESVVRVYEGEIFGVAEGSAIITATTNLGASDTITINVSGTPRTAPTLKSIELNKSTLRIEQGESYVLTATLKPWYYDSSNVDVTWRSTNEKIASIKVDENDPLKVTVSALNSGNCSIVCQSGKYITSKVNVVIKDQFVVEARTLKEYNGHGDENGVVTIPDDLGIIYINRYAFYNNDYIKKIIIPEGVKEIHDAAIYGCENLEEVVMPKSMEKLEKFAIAWNPNLKTVDLGGTKTIQKYAFVRDDSLVNIDLSNVRNIGYASFYGCTSLEVIDLSNCGGLGELSFAYCESLKDIIMSESTTLQGPRAFYSCDGLTSLVIPANYVAVGTFAFCNELTDVTFTNNVSTIDTVAFYQCTKLENVTFLGEVNTIADGAFAYCSSLKTIYLPAGLDVLSLNAYTGVTNVEKVYISKDTRLSNINRAVFTNCENLKEFDVETGNIYFASQDGILFDSSMTKLIYVPNALELNDYVIPNTVKVIGANAFSYNESLKSIDLANVEVIEEGAFFGCVNLATISNSDNLYKIDDVAFYGCQLNEIVIPTSVKYIGAGAFALTTNKSKEYNLVIPNTVEFIGEQAFYNNASITNVEFEANTKLTEISDSLFAKDTKLENVTFTSGIKKIGSNVFNGCTSLIRVTYPTSGITEFGEYNYFGCTSLTSVNAQAAIPRTVSSIPAYTFAKCSQVTSFTAPDNITSIGDYAFASSGLTGITLKKVEYIGNYAFNSTSIASISSNTVETVGEFAFANIKTLAVVKLPNVTMVDKAAFYNDSALNDLTLDSLVTIGEYAFYNTSSLTSINLPSLENIFEAAFYASAISIINAPKLKYIGELAFAATQFEEFNVPADVRYIGERVFAGAEKLKKITVSNGNPRYFSDNGVLYEILETGKYSLLVYPAMINLSDYHVLNNTVRIADFAFVSNKILKQVELPQSLKQIGTGAFADTIINTYIFHSYQAPMLESSYSTSSTQTTFYLNFKDYIANAKEFELSIKYPSNGVGYDEYLYSTYFKNQTKTTEVAPNDDTLRFKDIINNLPSVITLAEKDLVLEAYNLYTNILSKDMKKLITAEEIAKLNDYKAQLDKLM